MGAERVLEVPSRGKGQGEARGAWHVLDPRLGGVGVRLVLFEGNGQGAVHEGLNLRVDGDLHHPETHSGGVGLENIPVSSGACVGKGVGVPCDVAGDRVLHELREALPLLPE